MTSIAHSEQSSRTSGSIALFIGKPLASGGTELRSRRTGQRYVIEPYKKRTFEIYSEGYFLGNQSSKQAAIAHIEAVDLSVSAG
jgi:hypothetical protein